MTARSDNDLELWRQWDLSGRKPDALEPLLDKFEPLIQSQYRRYAGRVNIPDSAIRADLENRFFDAVGTYNPKKGTQLSTHVSWHLKGVHGFVTQNQNLGRIPENQAAKIRELTTATAQLQDAMGRVPDDVALASKMHWSPTQVRKLRRSLRRDLQTTGFAVPVGVYAPSRWEAIKSMLPAELSKEQKFVFQHTTGAGGAPILQAQEIAKRLGISNAGVSRHREDIARKLEQYGPIGSLPIGSIDAPGMLWVR